MNTFFKKISLSLLLASCVAIPALADDVEIFFNTNDPLAGGDPMVMFSLEYSPSVIRSQICQVGNCGDFDPYWSGVITSTMDAYDAEIALYAQNLIDYGAVSIDAGTGQPTIGDRVDFLEMLQGALGVVLNLFSDVKVGLMLSHDNINNCEGPANATIPGCSNGGYIAMGFQQGDGADSTNGGDDELIKKLRAIPPSTDGNDANPNQGKELYFELFRYLTGQAVYNGYNGYVDYGDRCDQDNLDDTTAASCGRVRVGTSWVDAPDDDYDLNGVGTDISWDTSIIDNTDTYISPFEDPTTMCSTVYGVNFVFNASAQDSDSDAAIPVDNLTFGTNGGMGYNINLDGSEEPGIDLSGTNNSFKTVLRWLFKDADNNLRDLADGTWGNAPEQMGEQNVKSFFLYKGTQQNTINGYAVAGGSPQGYEITDDPKVLLEHIKTIFEQIQRQNSTFEAPAVTVNSYSRLTHRDELYYALFSPEEDTPNWPGNLKKYKLRELDTGDGTTELQIADQNDVAAIDAGKTLFITTACSYWSDCDIDRSNPPDGDVDPDGDIVEWGGAAEELTASRSVYTYTGSDLDLTDSTNAVHESNTDITSYMLGVTTATIAGDMDGDLDKDIDDIALQRQRLLRLGRGVDPVDTSIALTSMGDPIHARPSVIEYDRDVTSSSNSFDEPDLAIAVSTNEGYFHLINAMSVAVDGVEPGGEFFSFIPGDLLPLIGEVNGPTEKTGVIEADRFGTYGLDGSPVTWPYDANNDGDIEAADGDHVWAFLPQRRGGNNIYALDITNKARLNDASAQTQPQLKWQIIGGTTSVDGDDFTELSQTWSEPSKAVIKDPNGIPTPVLVFGGGYDDDQDDAYSKTDDVGRAIYIVNADTGRLIWTISKDEADTRRDINEMESSIPAKVRVLDINEDNYIDRIYAVDIVGRVFRVDFDNDYDPDNDDVTETRVFGSGMVASLVDTTCPDSAPTVTYDAEGDPIYTAEPCQRRFYNAPDITLMVGYPVTPYFQIAMGSGFRAHPVTVKGIQNRFYSIYDPNVLDGQLSTFYGTFTSPDSEGDTQENYHWDTSDLQDVTTIPSENGTFGAAKETARDLLVQKDPATGKFKRGWFFEMNIDGVTGVENSDLKEHVLSESVTLQGLTFFTTYLREESFNDCEVDLGQGRLYVIDAFSGLPAADLNTKGLLQDSDTITDTSRFLSLSRTGIPSDPLIVFRKNSEGKIDPTVVVGSDLPLTDGEGGGILQSNAYTKTWWLDVE